MRLYDGAIAEALGLLEGRRGRLLGTAESAGRAASGPVAAGPDGPWPDDGDANLVLRGEMAYELGGSGLPALGGFAPTSSRSLVPRDEVWLYGPDLPELSADSPYARLAFVRVAEGGLGGEAELHAGIREVEYTRYRVSPRGFMPRVSVSSGRESVRVSEAALTGGLDFSRAGELFLAGYRRHAAVEAAKIIFITLNEFPYGELEEACRGAERITASLDRVFSGLSMDCSACDMKRVCDGVEGLRDLHFAQAGRQAARATRMAAPGQP